MVGAVATVVPRVTVKPQTVRPQVGIDGRGRLVAANVFPWHEAIKDLPGAYWAGGRPPGWAMPVSPGTAAALLTILSESGAMVSPRVMALATEAHSREARRSLAADESAPLPELAWHEILATDPWAHQKRGINYLGDCTCAAIGAGMGTGKSLMVVGGMNLLNIKKALMVVPTATFGVFPRELRLHSNREWHVDNGTRYTRRKTIKKLTLEERFAAMRELYACSCGRPHACIVGYEALVADPLASADLASMGVQLVVYDEAHRLKSAGGAMSRTAASWVNQIERRWGLSGTLMPQTPADIYGTYRALDPSIFGTNYTEFATEFIVTRKTADGLREFPVDVRKTKRLEFSQRFHSIAYVPEVDLELPPVTHTIRAFELEPKARMAYDAIRDTGVAEITAAAVAAGGEATPDGDVRTVTPANAGVERLRWAQITGGAVTDDDGRVTVVSTAKVDALGVLLDEVGCRKGGHDGRSRPEPVVVFCKYSPHLAAVERLGKKLGLRYREISGPRKDGLDADAKMHPECDLLGVQIAAGGVGIDLTRSRICVWYSVGGELWLFQQAQKRLDRPGQTRSVANFYLIAENTVDADVYTALARKENIIESVERAYLNHVAERASSELPKMEVPPGSVRGELPNLPAWLRKGSDVDAPRPVPDAEREAEQYALALGGLEGF